MLAVLGETDFPPSVLYINVLPFLQEDEDQEEDDDDDDEDSDDDLDDIDTDPLLAELENGTGGDDGERDFSLSDDEQVNRLLGADGDDGEEDEEEEDDDSDEDGDLLLENSKRFGLLKPLEAASVFESTAIVSHSLVLKSLNFEWLAFSIMCAPGNSGWTFSLLSGQL